MMYEWNSLQVLRLSQQYWWRFKSSDLVPGLLVITNVSDDLASSIFLVLVQENPLVWLSKLWRVRLQTPMKCWSLVTIPHGNIFQKKGIFTNLFWFFQVTNFSWFFVAVRYHITFCTISSNRFASDIFVVLNIYGKVKMQTIVN